MGRAHTKTANDQSLPIVLIEDIAAVKNLDEIAKVDHIDVFFVAPSDLAPLDLELRRAPRAGGRAHRALRLRGRARVMAGVDCGFGTFAGRLQVDAKIVWLKLQALTEGARLASRELW